MAGIHFELNESISASIFVTVDAFFDIHSHAYIWVHYFCTERPDMRLIYG